jgi:ATP-binding cassette subfamily C protein
MKACRSALGLAFLHGCGHNLLLLAPPLYLLHIYERVLSSRSADTLLMLTLVVAAAVVVGALLDAIRRAALARIGFWLEDRLRPVVVAAALNHARHGGPGASMEASRDLAALRQFLGSPACTALLDGPWALVFLGILFFVHPLLGAIAATAALVMLGCMLLNELLTRAPSNRIQAAEQATQQRLGAVLQNVQVIRAMGMLEGAARLIYRDVATAAEAHGSVMRRSEALQTVLRCTRALVQVLIMGAATWLVLQQHLSAGIIFASSLLLGRTLAPIEGVTGSWRAFGSARLAFRRLAELLAATHDDRARPAFPLPRPSGALSIENVTFVPPGTTTLVLQGVSLRVAPGECLGVVGPSGAGKSTLARMIMGIATPTMGRVRLDGADIGVWLETGGARHLGYLPQEIELFEGSIRDNIARLRNADPEAVVEAARLVGLHETIMRMPRGYDTQIEHGGLRLSGGQRQCLGLARAFFGSPRLIVLDEPNSNLDDNGEQALHRAVERMKAAGATIVILTHRLGILDATDKIAILRGGTLSAFGRSDEIYETYFRKLAAAPPPVEAAAPAGAVRGLPQAALPAANLAQTAGEPA